MRPAYWTSRPFLAIGAARNRVSSAGSRILPGVRAGRDGKLGRLARLRLELGEYDGPHFGAHAAAQDDGIVAHHARRRARSGARPGWWG
jgi:hypothetical protein